MSQYDLSVVICVRNGASVIGRQLVALDAQVTNKKFEIIIVDNNSDDGTWEVLEVWRDSSGHAASSISLVHGPDTPGIPAARNAGARAASGRVLAFCDADDEVSEGWVEAFSAVQDGELAGGWIRTREAALNGTPDVFGKGLIATAYLPHIGNCNCAITRKTFFADGGYDESLPRYGYEDVELSWRHQELGGTMRFISEAVVWFTVSQGKASISKKFVLGAGRILMARRFPKYDSAQYTVLSTTRDVFKNMGQTAKVAITDRTKLKRQLSITVASLGRVWGTLKYSGKNHYPQPRLITET